MRHTGTPELETDRLLLRRLLPQDAPQMYENWANDPAVTRFLRWEPHKSPAETGNCFRRGQSCIRTRIITSGPW